MPNIDLRANFTYHPPTNLQVEKYELIRSKAHDVAELIQVACPESRERSIAITKLEEAVMWANASIAREKV